jgi:hypothetical protein
LEFFHVAKELSDLVGLGLAAINLEIQRARRPGVLENVMAAPDPIQPVAKCFGHFAQVLKPDISGTGQEFLINLTRCHCPKRPKVPTTSFVTLLLTGS